MIMKYVSSSNISSVGYDMDKKLLRVEFKNGSVYDYFNVPQSEHDNLINAASVGSYFNQNIRTAYEYAGV